MLSPGFHESRLNISKVVVLHWRVLPCCIGVVLSYAHRLQG